MTEDRRHTDRRVSPSVATFAVLECARLREENTMLRDELERIACANPRQWDKEVRDQFQQWAQNRARFTLDKARAAIADAAKPKGQS